MTTPEILYNGSTDSRFTLALAHGAGAPMDSDFMVAFAEGLAERGMRTARFEFPYMVRRRLEGRKFPPNPARILIECWQAVISEIGAEGLIIGGKSMGGRIASMVADEAQVAGLVCLGYPFHATGKPEKTRVEHLQDLKTPALFCQGERDTLGSRDDVAGYTLSDAIHIHWLPDGDHGFKPRKKSGFSEPENWASALDAIQTFTDHL